MALEYLKRGKPDAERAKDDAKTKAVVEATLKDIERRGDAAVRDLSVQEIRQLLARIIQTV